MEQRGEAHSEAEAGWAGCQTAELPTKALPPSPPGPRRGAVWVRRTKETKSPGARGTGDARDRPGLGAQGPWGQLPLEFPAPGGALAQASWFPCHRGAPRGLTTRRANSRSAGFVAPSRPEPVSAAGTDPGNWRGRLGRAKWGLEA